MAIVNDNKDRRSGVNTWISFLLLIKDMFAPKEHKTGSTTEYRTMTDNNLTDALKDNYDAGYQHSLADHAPKSAQENVVESVKLNGTALTVTNKSVDIPVPLISTDIYSDRESNVKTASPKAVVAYIADIVAQLSGSGLRYKKLVEGEYDPDTGVPTVEGVEGWFYFVPIVGTTNNAHNEYLYIDGVYEFIGTTTVDLSGYMKKDDIVEFTTEEVQAIWSQVFSGSSNSGADGGVEE